MAKVEYKKEFFDREYGTIEAYRRVWKYARKYKFRLVVGIVSGMLTAGTLVPFFQIVQPALQHAESHDKAIAAESADVAKADSAVEAEAPAQAVEKRAARNAFDKAIDKNSKLPSWYPTVEKWASRCGISLQSEKGGVGGALVLIVCVIVPLVAFVRLGLMFLNNY